MQGILGRTVRFRMQMQRVHTPGWSITGVRRPAVEDGITICTLLDLGHWCYQRRRGDKDGARDMGARRGRRILERKGPACGRCRLGCSGAIGVSGHPCSGAERRAEPISSYSAVVKWAEEAIKWYGSELGEDSKQVAGMRETAADPRSHAAWGTRRK